MPEVVCTEMVICYGVYDRFFSVSLDGQMFVSPRQWWDKLILSTYLIVSDRLCSSWWRNMGRCMDKKFKRWFWTYYQWFHRWQSENLVLVQRKTWIEIYLYRSSAWYCFGWSQSTRNRSVFCTRECTYFKFLVHWTVAATCALDAQIKLWDIESGKLIRDIDATPGNIAQNLFYMIFRMYRF